MSKSITIRAADSAQAMEEVVRQLGPDALILSSSRKGGQFEIVAMLEEGAGEDADKPPLAERLQEALNASGFASETSKAAPASAPNPTPVSKPENIDPDSPIGRTSPTTFEALLKRRLEEEGVSTDLSPDAAALQEMRQKRPMPEVPPASAIESAAPLAPPEAEIQAEAAASPIADPIAEPAIEPQVPVAAADLQPPVDAPAETPEDTAALFRDAVPQPVAPELAPVMDRQQVAQHPEAEFAPPVSGLGGFDIPAPVLPRQVAQSIREDLENYDRCGQLKGLTQAIVSSLLPERATEPLGAGRFWLAGPDMRHKALAAIRIAIRKLDAGEAKPSFYVMGSQARADAAFLASKAELLGLTVMLVDETVGRNLPDNVPGSQIILLPDDPEVAKDYAEKFQHDGDKGLFVLPSVYGRELLTPMMALWADTDVQMLLVSSKYAPVSAALLACLLQFNKQVAWTSDGEEVLDNLIPADAVTVSDWMRPWLPADAEALPQAPVAAVAPTPLFHSHSLPVQ